MITLPTISDIIASIESSNNRYSLRFEQQAFFGDKPEQTSIALLLKIGRINNCNSTTSKMIACTSWGLFQIMGFNLYSLSKPLYIEPIGKFLSDQSAQETVFRMFCLDNGLETDITVLRDNKLARDNFAKRYNGPGDVDTYSARILAAINRLTVVTPDAFA